MRQFVIVAEARSGTTMLGSAIGRHPQVVMHGEIFGAGHFPLNFYGIDEDLPWPTPLEIHLKKLRDRDPVQFLDQLVFADTARHAVGFKFKFQEFELWPGVQEYIRRREIPIIYIRRRNLLERYISDMEALHTGTFNSTDAASFGNVAQVNIAQLLTIERIKHALDMSLQYQSSFQSLFLRNARLELVYEEVISNWQHYLGLICRFLEIVELDLAPLTAKRPHQRGVDEMFDRAAISSELAKIGYASYV